MIIALEDGCSFNGLKLEKNKQYSINFDTLDRSGNGGSEYFMQKQCATHLKGLKSELMEEFKKIINSVEI